MMENTGNKMNALKRGVVIFVILGVLTAIEYFLGVIESPSILLWIIALLKGGLVLWYFMHLPRVFSAGGDHE
jgi:heme/copper-type cytochrome/quinol oxidase subunit 4